MSELRYIECPECKAHIREDSKKCMHCRSVVNKPYRGMSQASAKFVAFFVFALLIVLSANLEPFLESTLDRRLTGGDIGYIIMVDFVLMITILFYIGYRGKKKHEQKNQKVYVDAPVVDTPATA